MALAAVGDMSGSPISWITTEGLGVGDRLRSVGGMGEVDESGRILTILATMKANIAIKKRAQP